MSDLSVLLESSDALVDPAVPPGSDMYDTAHKYPNRPEPKYAFWQPKVCQELTSRTSQCHTSWKRRVTGMHAMGQISTCQGAD